MKKDITDLFCFVDDFAQGIEGELNAFHLPKTLGKPTRIPGLTMGEMMSIILS